MWLLRLHVFLYYAEKNNSSLFLLSAKKCFFLEKDRRFNFFLIVFFPAILLMTLSATHSHFIRMPRWSPLSCGGGLATQSCLTLATPWTVAHQAPLSMGFSRQEYWSELHFLLQGIFPAQGLNLGEFCLLNRSVSSGHPSTCHALWLESLLLSFH